jgi:hypothetical protein
MSDEWVLLQRTEVHIKRWRSLEVFDVGTDDSFTE